MRAVPSLSEAQRELRPALVAVLASLAARGYPVGLDDGQDLIQGFFADQWERLRQTYDPAKGDPEPYVRAAFWQYATRNTLRRARQRAQLLDPASLADAGGLTLADDAPLPDAQADIARVSEALGGLPADYCEALTAFITHRSERRAADALGWSRHRLWTTLAEAVGQVALSVDRPHSVPEADWAVSRLVLGSSRTVTQAARLLGQSPDTARKAHRRTLNALVAALRAAL